MVPSSANDKYQSGLSGCFCSTDEAKTINNLTNMRHTRCSISFTEMCWELSSFKYQMHILMLPVFKMEKLHSSQVMIWTILTYSKGLGILPEDIFDLSAMWPPLWSTGHYFKFIILDRSIREISEETALYFSELQAKKFLLTGTRGEAFPMGPKQTHGLPIASLQSPDE